MSGEIASPVSSTPGSKRITTSPAAASMPALTAPANPSGGASLIDRSRSAARLCSQAAIRSSPELSTMSASKSALQFVKTESSHRSASGFQPCTTVSRVTARGSGAGAVLAGAFSAWSSLPLWLSTTSHPPSRKRSRMASASAKFFARRRTLRSAANRSASSLSIDFGWLASHLIKRGGIPTLKRPVRAKGAEFGRRA
jgi:hypothetical protein